jgi:hypothetical protein
VSGNFAVELDELESVRAKLQALIQDHFETATSPLANETYHNNTASDVSQTGLPAQIKRNADYGDTSTNFGPTDQGVDAIITLNAANGQVQQAVYALLGEVNTKIGDLHDRIQKTHQMYAATEQNLHLDLTQVQKNT